MLQKTPSVVSPELTEHCCSITTLQLGDSIQNIAKDMDTHSYKVPLGVCAGKCYKKQTL